MISLLQLVSNDEMSSACSGEPVHAIREWKARQDDPSESWDDEEKFSCLFILSFLYRRQTISHGISHVIDATAQQSKLVHLEGEC